VVFLEEWHNIHDLKAVSVLVTYWVLEWLKRNGAATEGKLFERTIVVRFLSCWKKKRGEHVEKREREEIKGLQGWLGRVATSVPSKIRVGRRAAREIFDLVTTTHA